MAKKKKKSSRVQKLKLKQRRKNNNNNSNLESGDVEYRRNQQCMCSEEYRQRKLEGGHPDIIWISEKDALAWDGFSMLKTNTTTPRVTHDLASAIQMIRSRFEHLEDTLIDQPETSDDE